MVSSRPETAAVAPWSKLQGQVVLVTGASSGLGREFCLDLARAGCRVIAAARRTDRLQSLCDEINAAAEVPLAVAVELDVAAGESAVEAAVQRAWDAFGRVDVLINNAGLRGGVHSALDWPKEEWDKLMKTNLRGLWLVSKHVCRRMCGAKLKGSVINISSNSGLDGAITHGSLAYSASKAAVHSVTKLMALELGALGIRVNTIAPGIFKSEITATLLQKSWAHNVFSKILPLKKFGTIDPALTSLVRFLIHETSSYINGNVFVVDSGYILSGLMLFSSL